MRPSDRTFVMLEPYAWKQARTVLRELGGGNAAWLPGCICKLKNGQYNQSNCISIAAESKYSPHGCGKKLYMHRSLWRRRTS